MTAFEIPNMRFSGIAKEAIKQAMFVTVDADETYKVAPDDSKPIAVSMNEAKEGNVLEMADGIVMVVAAEKVTAGDAIKVKDGKAAKDAEGKGIAVALTTANANELVTIKFI